MKPDHSPTFETDLAEYARTADAELFNQKLVTPIKSLIRWLCNNNSIFGLHPQDMDDVNQFVFMRLVKDIRYYRPDKGNTAISFCRMLCEQELKKRSKAIQQIHQHEHDQLEANQPEPEYQPPVMSEDAIRLDILELYAKWIELKKQSVAVRDSRNCLFNYIYRYSPYDKDTIRIVLNQIWDEQGIKAEITGTVNSATVNVARARKTQRNLFNQSGSGAEVSECDP